MYQRVIPRDLFNESKLLKCLGRLVVAIEDGMLPTLKVIQPSDPADGFKVDLDEANNELWCQGLEFYCGRREVQFSTPYNSREDWPLIARIGNSDAIDVFTSSDGPSRFSQEFLKLIGDKSKPTKRS